MTIIDIILITGVKAKS